MALSIILLVGFGSFVLYDKVIINRISSNTNQNSIQDVEQITDNTSTKNNSEIESTTSTEQTEDSSLKEVTPPKQTEVSIPNKISNNFEKVFTNTKVGYRFNYKNDYYVGVMFDMDMFADYPKELRDEFMLEPNFDPNRFPKNGSVIFSSKPIPNLQDPEAVKKSNFDMENLSGGISITKNDEYYKSSVPKDAKEIRKYSLRGYSCKEYELMDNSGKSITGECILGNNNYSYFYPTSGEIPFDPKSIILTN
jgi:hypothetical protein